MSLSSTSKNRVKVAAIFILAIFCALTVWPKVPAGTPFENFWNKSEFHLGLDLQGGTHLVYEADTSAIDEGDRELTVEGVRDVIERRVNAFGVGEPIVQTDYVGNQYRVIVELPGITDISQAVDMIGETPILEFKEINPSYNPELTESEQKQLDEENLAVKNRAEAILVKALAGDDFETLAKENSEDSSAAQGGNLGFAKKGMFVPEFESELFDNLENGEVSANLVETQFGYHIIKRLESRGDGDDFEVSSQHILLRTKSAVDIKPIEDQWLNTELSGKHLVRSQVQFSNQTSEPQVSLDFNDEGQALFAEITERNVGKQVAIFLDGEPVTVPTVNEPITNGSAVITGRFNVQEAKEIAQRLNAGALPVPIKLMSQQTVGASLGHESVDKSISAGLIGLLAVAVFMILFYRVPGVLSVVALAIYTLLVLTIFKVFSMTLTLAGVAGFILSIGMAVDANVLIFERLKEELKNDREITGAVEEGFKRAWTSIRDSNISTFIICIILILFGTSVVRGFGWTLLIGVAVSMFSAIIITRSFLRIFHKKRGKIIKWLFGVSS